MDVVLLRLVELHDRGLGTVAVPAVARALLPAVQAWLVDPLVVLPTKDERVLLPYKALTHTQADVMTRAPEVVPFRVRVEDVERRTRLQRLLGVAERRPKELSELHVLHRVVLDRESVRPLVGDVVGWVGEPTVRLLRPDELLHVLGLGRVAAEEPVGSQDVRLARLRVGDLRNFRDGVLLGLPRRHRLAAEERFEFRVLEGQHRNVEARLLEPGHLDLQLLLVPLRDLRDLVVGDAQGLLLLLGEVLLDDAGNLLHAELLAGGEARVAFDDDMILVDEDRVMETELRDDLGERVDRALVDARVVLIGLQLAQFQVYDLHVSSSCCFMNL